ncbi:MAG: undecaprenyl-diphosphatase UppP [bacterium]
MSIIEAIILGVVQGITEFLPISSSGHLIFFPELFGWDVHALDFDVMIHLATVLAILWVMWGDILKIGKDLFGRKGDKTLFWKIVVGTLPVVIFGLAISGAYFDQIRTVRLVAINLALWGAVLWAADWYSESIKNRIDKIGKVKWWQAVVIGVFQAIALLPGSSRSGLTITAGLFAGLDRKTAAKFSFLLAIPAIAGAGVLTGYDALQTGLETPLASMIVGFIAAFIAGGVSIRFLFRFIEKANYRWFAAYRIILALILFMFIT